MDIKNRRTHFFERHREGLEVALRAEVAEEHIEAIVSEAADWFAENVDEIPYADQPDHTMAQSILACYSVLAYHQPLRVRGYDEHVLGRAVIDSLQKFLAAMPVPEADAEATADGREKMMREAMESQQEAAAGEFVFEMVDGDETTDYGMNVLSCAVCHAFSKHDAMGLVPYMCASDDVVSDAVGQGLRRTGTIALGAHHCDFRYQQHGEPKRLEAQYPEQIRLQSI